MTEQITHMVGETKNGVVGQYSMQMTQNLKSLRRFSIKVLNLTFLFQILQLYHIQF